MRESGDNKLSRNSTSEWRKYCVVAFLLVGGFQQVTPHSAPLEVRNHPVISVLLFLFSKGLFSQGLHTKISEGEPILSKRYSYPKINGL